MKGFDDHLDNYGDPGDDSLYPECEHTPPCTGDREDAPCFNDDEPTVIVEGREYFTFHDDAICPECGASRPVGRIADHMASAHPDYTDDDEPPFDENHYRFHTPAGPNPACVNCQWRNWDQPRGETGNE